MYLKSSFLLRARESFGRTFHARRNGPHVFEYFKEIQLDVTATGFQNCRLYREIKCFNLQRVPIRDKRADK